MPAGVENIPAPTTRLMIRNAVDHVPSFLSKTRNPDRVRIQKLVYVSED